MAERFSPNSGGEKGISSVIAATMFLLIVVAIAGVATIYISVGTQNAMQSVESQLERESGGIPSIEKVDVNKVYVKSAGRTELILPTFYVAGRKVDATGPETVLPGDTGVYVLDDTQLVGMPRIVELKVTTNEGVDIVTAALRSLWKIISAPATVTGLVTGFENGILFQDINGTDLAAITSAGNVGIGTTSPGGALEIVRSGSTAMTILRTYNTADTTPEILMYAARGTSSNPSAIQSGDTLLQLAAFGYGTTGFSSVRRGYINLLAAENWTDSAQGTYWALATTAAGGTTRTEKLRIDSNGNVGIGTTEPANKLEVNGGARFLGASAGASSGAGAEISYTGGTVYYQAYDRATSVFLPVALDGSTVKLRISGSDKVTIDTAGNVGIGTTGPTAKLHVNDSETGIHDSFLIETQGDQTPRIRFRTNGVDRFDVLGDSDHFAIDSAGSYGSTGIVLKSGNVGIGTASPGALLDVGGTTLSSSGILTLEAGGKLTTASGNDLNLDIPSTRSLLIKLAGTTKVVVDNQGNVGIGTASPGYKLDVNGNIVNSNPSQGYLALSGDLPGYTAGTYPTLKTGGSYIYFSVAGYYSAYMNYAGTLTGVSSRDAKTNFVTLDTEDVLAKIRSLPVTQWNFKKENSLVKHIGPTAEDFYAAFGLNGNSTKMLASSDVAGVALLGTKSLLTKVDEQQKEIDELKEQVSQLKKENEALKSP